MWWTAWHAGSSCTAKRTGQPTPRQQTPSARQVKKDRHHVASQQNPGVSRSFVLLTVLLCGLMPRAHALSGPGLEPQLGVPCCRLNRLHVVLPQATRCRMGPPTPQQTPQQTTTRCSGGRRRSCGWPCCACWREHPGSPTSTSDTMPFRLCTGADCLLCGRNLPKWVGQNGHA